MSDFYPALDQQRGERPDDYFARLERERAVAVGPHFDPRRHQSICDHLTTASGRLPGLALERVKEAVQALSLQDRVQLLQWLAESQLVETTRPENTDDAIV
jgi:hypothetical protein